MTTVNDLHPRAMDLADVAFRLLRNGEDDRAHDLFLQALRLEAEAASLLTPSAENEPSRSILYRSAASLAFHAGEYDTAERLVAQGLIGFPPDEIREELKTLYDNINSKRHMRLQGVVAVYDQAQINYGQQRINYELVRVDTRLIEVCRTLVEILKSVKSIESKNPQLKTIDFKGVDEAIAGAEEIIEKVSDIRPPGTESPYPD